MKDGIDQCPRFSWRKFRVGRVSAFVAAILALLESVHGIQKLAHDLLSLYLPSACIFVLIAGCTICIILIEQLLISQAPAIIGGSPFFVWRKGSRGRRTIWTFLLLISFVTVALTYFMWQEHYNLDLPNDTLLVFVDRFDLKGWDQIQFEKRIQTSLQEELRKLVPQVRVELLQPPEGIDCKEDRIKWACDKGAKIIIHGSGDQNRIWPEIKICSDSVRGWNIHPGESAIDITSALSSQYLADRYVSLAPIEAARLCLIDSLVPTQINYLTDVALGLVLLEVAHSPLRDRLVYQRAHDLFARAVQLRHQDDQCEANYCEALYDLGFCKLMLTQSENDQRKNLMLLLSAEAVFTESLRLNPDLGDSWYALGIISYWLGRLEQARSQLDRAISYENDNPNYWYCRAMILGSLNRGQEAVLNYDSALIKGIIDPPSAWYNRGLQLFELGLYSEAQASYENAIGIKRNFVEAWNNRGNALGVLGRYGDAIASYDSSIKYRASDPLPWYNRGKALADSGNSELAIASFDSAIARRHDYADAWCNRGSSLTNAGLYDQALASYDSALTYTRESPFTWYSLGTLLACMGRPLEAIASFDSCLKYKHDYPLAWYNRGIALDTVMKPTLSLSSFDSAISYKHDFPEAWNRRGWVLFHLGIYDKAKLSFDSSLFYRHSHAGTWYSLALALYKLGRHDQALASADSALRFHPDMPEAIQLRKELLKIR